MDPRQKRAMWFGTAVILLLLSIAVLIAVFLRFLPTEETLESQIATSTATSAVSQIWVPELHTTWQWQLTGVIDRSIEADVYDIDLFDIDESTIASLHNDGKRVICYFSAGTWEDWRADAEAFPDSIVGNDLEDWEGEKWLDIRQLELLRPLMEARFNLAVSKGCDAVEPDNVDGYTHDTGFPLGYGDQLKYNIFLSQEAHKRDLSIGLKNNHDQIEDLLPYFDWALDEQCFEHDTCELLSPFIEAGKAVFNVEYALEPEDFCEEANTLNFNSLKKNRDLDAEVTMCR